MSIQVEDKHFWRKWALYAAKFGGIAIIVRGLFVGSIMIVVLWMFYSFFNYFTEENAAAHKRFRENWEKSNQEMKEGRDRLINRWHQLDNHFHEFSNEVQRKIGPPPNEKSHTKKESFPVHSEEWEA